MTSKLINITDKNIEPKFETPANKTLSYLNDSIQLNKDNNELNISNQIRINGCGFLKNNKKAEESIGTLYPNVVFPNSVYNSDNTVMVSYSGQSSTKGFWLFFYDLIIGNQNYSSIKEKKTIFLGSNMEDFVGKQYVIFAEVNEKVTKITETYIADNGLAIPKEEIKREWDFVFEKKELVNNNLNEIINNVYGSWDTTKQYKLVQNKTNKYGCLWTLSDTNLEIFKNQTMDGSAIIRNTYKICLGCYEFEKDWSGWLNIKHRSILGNNFILDGFQNDNYIQENKINFIKEEDINTTPIYDTVENYILKSIDYNIIEEKTLKLRDNLDINTFEITGNSKTKLLYNEETYLDYANWRTEEFPKWFYLKDFWEAGSQYETYNDVKNNISTATITSDYFSDLTYIILTQQDVSYITNYNDVVFHPNDIVIYNKRISGNNEYYTLLGFISADGRVFGLDNDVEQSNILQAFNYCEYRWKTEYCITFTNSDVLQIKLPICYVFKPENDDIKIDLINDNELLINKIVDNITHKYSFSIGVEDGIILDKNNDVVGTMDSSYFTNGEYVNCVLLWDIKLWNYTNYGYGTFLCCFNNKVKDYYTHKDLIEKEKIGAKQFTGEVINTPLCNIKKDGSINGIEFNVLIEDHIEQYDDEADKISYGSMTGFQFGTNDIDPEIDVEVFYEVSHEIRKFLFNKTLKIGSNTFLKYNEEYNLDIFFIIFKGDGEAALYKRNNFIEDFSSIDIKYYSYGVGIDYDNILTKNNVKPFIKSDTIDYLVGTESWNSTSGTKIGSIRFASWQQTTNDNDPTIGQTVEGSKLKQLAIQVDENDSTVLIFNGSGASYTGTWKVMNFMWKRLIGTTYYRVGLFMRII